MPRKVFLSFLGVSNYEPVNYYIESEHTGGMAPLEKYVQKALLNHLAQVFQATDRAVIFLTKEARATNWEKDGHVAHNTGIKNHIRSLGQAVRDAAYPFDVEAVDIDGESEPSAIWRTFQTVYAQLEKGDEVYFDITYSWRYLPMLGMTLLNYAKVLKQIEVKAIYYGALERLGSISEVRLLPKDKRPVPILNLVSFSELQDWAVSADDLVRNGNPERLAFLTHKNLTPIIVQSQGKDEVARNLRDISQQLNGLAALLATNRGRQIWEFDYPTLHGALAAFSAEKSYIKPLNGVVDHIKNKVNGFKPTGQLQWLEGVRWCLNHGLVQQGVTQLQEGLLSWLCTHYEKKGWAEPGYFDLGRKNARNLLSAALQFIIRPPQSKWTGEISRHKFLAERIMGDPVASELARPYSKLSQARNDINHGGYTSNRNADVFFQQLKDNYYNIRDIIERLAPESEEPEIDLLNVYNRPAPQSEELQVGLLNVSNHPFEDWPARQRQMAEQQFGRVADLPFPNIPPHKGNEELAQLVNEYFQKIQSFRPTAVHLMGEMTFTFALVQKLKAAGTLCLASTTERLVQEKGGKKVVEFRFVQFRPY